MKKIILTSLFFGLAVFAETAKTVTNPEILKSTQKLNQAATDYNKNPNVEQFVKILQELLGHEFKDSEKSFIAGEIKNEKIPHVEVKGNLIQIFDGGPSKDLLLTIEIVDANKNKFRYGGKEFQLDPNKPMQDNIQMIVRGLGGDA